MRKSTFRTFRMGILLDIIKVHCTNWIALIEIEIEMLRPKSPVPKGQVASQLPLGVQAGANRM